MKSKKMKIAFVSDAIWPYNKGGKERRLFEISSRLAKAGHNVHIYCMNWWDGKKVFTKDRITYHGISKNYSLYTKKGRRSVKQALLFSLALLKPLLKERYDLIEADGFPYFPIISSWFVAKLKKERMVVTWHEVWDEYWFRYLGWKGLFGFLVERLCAQLTKEAIVVSKLTENRLRMISKAKTYLIPNGIDIQTVKKTKPSKQGFDVLFAGRLIKEKNVDKLILAVKDSYKLGIIGDGPEKDNLIKLAKPYSNITFLGKLPRVENVYAYMKASKVFAFPSEREGFGITVLEALACGCKVVTVNEKMNASADLIRSEKDGFVVVIKHLGQGIKLALDLECTCIICDEIYRWEHIYKKYLITIKSCQRRNYENLAYT